MKNLPDFSNALTPESFGARGDGESDDLPAINATLREARSKGRFVVLAADKTYAIAGYVELLDGNKGLAGKGGVLRLLDGPDAGGVLLKGRASGAPTNCQDVLVTGVVVDAAGPKVRTRCIGIYGQNPSRCEIRGNTIRNLRNPGTGILIRSFIAGGEHAVGNVIADNLVEGAQDADASAMFTAIEIGAEPDVEGLGAPPAVSRWLREHRALTSQWQPVYCVVKGNCVSGGYYGISLLGAHFCSVHDNRLQANVRSISVQSGCTSNVIARNQCRESLSSAIHLAYGSNDNLIESNVVETRRARGEGLLQAYVGCERNVFRDNSTFSEGGTYHLYSAVNAIGNRFEQNELSGVATKAYIALESAWSPVLARPAHRATGGRSISGRYASTASSDLALIANRLDGSSGVPAIWLAQVEDLGGRWPLRHVSIRANIIKGNAYSCDLVRFEANPGLMSDVEVSSNRFGGSAVPRPC